mgnify:CR=1 FL=1|tara:strand:- start:787 stop:1248 length:462 start_codon:yes stop_codon:yes gene_type:complete
MDLFISKFLNKIDKKGRVSLPSSFRNALPKSNKNEIILYKSIKTQSIEGCGIGRLEEIAKRINNLDFFSEDHDDFSASIFSEIISTNIDKEGRFQIPEELKKYANIENEAAFYGQGYFFQIWKPNNGSKYIQNSRLRLLKEKKSLRMILTDKN